MLPHYIYLAHDCYDTLVKMGGRPTRKIQEELAWKAVYEVDEVRISDHHGGLQSTVGLGTNLTSRHWAEEWAFFREELYRWTTFKEYQSTMKPKPLLKIDFDPENTDERLAQIWLRLDDWREFQNYQLQEVGHATMWTWRSTRHAEQMMRKEPASGAVSASFETQEEWRTCLRRLLPRQRDLESSQKQLTWIESQIVEILSEACASLKDDTTLQLQLLSKLKQHAHRFHQELTDLGAEPYFPLQFLSEPPDIAQMICYWGSKITLLMQQHWEWKIFLRWRISRPYTEKPVNIEQGSLRHSPDLQMRADYVNYQQYQLDRARSWVAAWERLLEWKESYLDDVSMTQCLDMFETITTIRAYVKIFQQDVQNGEVRGRSAEKLLDKLSYRLAKPQDTPSSSTHAQMPLSLPKTEPCESNLGEARIEHLIDRLHLCEVIGEDEGVVSWGNISGSAKDISMADVEVPVKAISPAPRNQITACRSIPREPKVRKSRTIAKLDQTISNSVSKHKGQKPAKPAKKFTEQQTTALLNAASAKNSPTDSRPVRRSQRLGNIAPAYFPLPNSTALRTNIRPKNVGNVF